VLAAGVLVHGCLCGATVEALQETHEIGPVLAESVRSWLDEPRNRGLIERLRAAGVRMEVPPEERLRRDAPGPLQGPHLRRHGHARVDDPRSGHAAIEALAAKLPARSARRQRGDRRGRRRQQSGQKRATWASRFWMRPRFSTC
jgi:DNA ligase (NAD+)